MIVTDELLNEKARFEIIVGVDHPEEVVWSSVAKKMHKHSKLYQRWKATGNNQARQQVLEFIQKCGGEKPVLAGSSVHFDRRFLTEEIPELNDILHHRILDVSFFTVLRDMWHLEAFAPPKVEPKHTAISDIEHSIWAFKWYRNTALKPEFGPKL